MDSVLEDRIISEFLRSLGPWKDYVVIGGGYALIVYQFYLAEEVRNPPVGTRDIDSLIPRKVPAVSTRSIADHLLSAGFSHVFKDLGQPASESYVKKIGGTDIEIEFLTDLASRVDSYKNVAVAGVVAQPLSYLSLSLQSHVKFQTKSGECGVVVSPGVWMLHKGLCFTKRRHSSKRYKDLYGIWYVATQLGSFSTEAINELRSLINGRRKWFRTFRRNLDGWVKEASPREWTQLESQDPSGRLGRLNFKKAIQDVLSS